ncbi:MAG: poly-beta-1,6 N-acetyl-D-glucosamine export porin PgaA [Comamonas sp.]
MHTRSASRYFRQQVPRAISVAVLVTCLGSTALAQAPSTAASRDQLLQLAQQRRDAQQWDEALAYYRQGRAQYPQDTAFQYGEIYALADSGQQAQASELADGVVRQAPDSADAMLVKAYTQLRQNGNFAALEYVDKAQQMAPNKGYVVREYIFALQRAGMASQALELAQRHPDLLTPAQFRALQSDEAAEWVRFSRVTSRSEAERFVIADKALARYDALFAQWKAQGPETAPLIQQARIDRLQALHSRAYMSELVREYEDLQAAGVDIPLFALGDVASAYLYLRQPEKAEAIYKTLAASGYMRNEDRARLAQDQGLMYAYTDQDKLAEAQQHVHAMQQNYSKWRYVEGEKSNVPNESYLEVQHTGIMMGLYANDTAGAQTQLKELVDAAPWNNSLRTDLAWAYRIRGWPRLSEQELKIAEGYEPRSLNVEVNQGQTALALQEWRQAELLSADTISRFPEATQAKRLARAWEVHNMAELQVSGYKGLSKGGSNDNGNPVFGSRDFGLETTLYTPPLNYNWRLFAGAGHRTGTFPEGKGQQNFGRVGLEWRSRDWWAEGEISGSSFGQGSKTGARVAAAYDIDDYWQLSAAANWRSRATPLRALHNGVTSNSVELGLRWRQSDLREWGIGITPSRFSDGNHRTELMLNGKERLLTRTTWFLDLGIEGYAAHNSRTDVPYYSPRNEVGLMPVLHWNHTLYQRYETQWTQKASIGLGGVHQQGYGTGAAQFISYGQRYKHNDVLEMGATLSGLRRPYDGVHEREWRLVFDLTYRF